MSNKKNAMVRYSLILSALMLTTFARANADSFQVKYDRFQDQTSVFTESYHIDEFTQISASFIFPGERMRTRPRRIGMLLQFDHMRAVDKPNCETACEVRIIIDGKRLPVTLHTTNPQLVGTLDFASLEVSLATFRRIATAKTVEIAIGMNEAPKLSDAELSAFREMVRYIDAANPSAK